jgi:hypothetical protein
VKPAGIQPSPPLHPTVVIIIIIAEAPLLVPPSKVQTSVTVKVVGKGVLAVGQRPRKNVS